MITMKSSDKYTFWTPEREDYLKENWGKLSCCKIAVRICISKDAVLGKARRMGLPNLGHKKTWTEQDESVLREMWGKYFARDIAAKLGKTKDAVTGKADRMGLSGRVKTAQSVPLLVATHRSNSHRSFA